MRCLLLCACLLPWLLQMQAVHLNSDVSMTELLYCRDKETKDGKKKKKKDENGAENGSNEGSQDDDAGDDEDEEEEVG